METSAVKNPYYLETAEKLNIRIQAHTQFTSLQLEEWLLAQLGQGWGKNLLEIGCGDGNFFPTYFQAIGPEGLIVGFDINQDLAAKAEQHGRQCGAPVRIFVWDFDNHPYPLADDDFDFVLAPFCAYYSKNVDRWVEDTLRVLKSGGLLLLLGPTRENARELYVLNEIVTGIGSVEETDDTSNKLENAFYPALQRKEGVKVEKITIDREIIFPSAAAFARYYFATWLYEKTREKINAQTPYDEVLRAVDKVGLRLNKKVICIKARKV